LRRGRTYVHDVYFPISRVTRGRIELHKEEIELAMVVAHAVETSRPFIDQRRHALTSMPTSRGCRR
jgi:hypothetical protein